jgi:hypothetical protein
MINFSIQGKDTIAAKVKNLGPAVRRSARKRLGIVGEHLATYYREHFEESGLHVRSGDMRRSGAMMAVEEDEYGLRGGLLVGQGLPYPPVQEFGATITPKTAQHLAIPLDAALTDAGVARFSPRDAEAAGYKTFVRGKIMYGTRDGQLFPLFVLVDSVTIPARPTVGPTRDANRDWIENQLHEAINEALKEAGE